MFNRFLDFGQGRAHTASQILAFLTVLVIFSSKWTNSQQSCRAQMVQSQAICNVDEHQYEVRRYSDGQSGWFQGIFCGELCDLRSLGWELYPVKLPLSDLIHLLYFLCPCMLTLFPFQFVSLHICFTSGYKWIFL